MGKREELSVLGASIGMVVGFVTSISYVNYHGQTAQQLQIEEISAPMRIFTICGGAILGAMFGASIPPAITMLKDCVTLAGEYIVSYANTPYTDFFSWYDNY